MTLTLPAILEQQLQSIASESDIPFDELVQEAIEDFVASSLDLNFAVGEGEASAERDGWVGHEDAVKTSRTGSGRREARLVSPCD